MIRCYCKFKLKIFFKGIYVSDPLERWITKHTIDYDNQRLSLSFSIEKVYPMPNCRLKLDDTVIAIMQFKKDYTYTRMLPRVTYCESLNVDQSLCDPNLNVECWNELNKNFSLVMQQKLTNFSCNGESMKINIAIIIVAVTVGIIVIVSIVLVILTIRRIKSNSQQHSNLSNKSDYNNEMLLVSPVAKDEDGEINCK